MLRDDDKPLEEKEFPDGADLGADGCDAELVRCPSCGRMIHEEAQQCPHCRWWISDDARAGAASGITGKWWLWAAIAAIVALIAWEVLR